MQHAMALAGYLSTAVCIGYLGTRVHVIVRLHRRCIRDREGCAMQCQPAHAHLQWMGQLMPQIELRRGAAAQPKFGPCRRSFLKNIYPIPTILIYGKRTPDVARISYQIDIVSGYVIGYGGPDTGRVDLPEAGYPHTKFSTKFSTCRWPYPDIRMIQLYMPGGTRVTCRVRRYRIHVSILSKSYENELS
eukprot:SAG31_NODE_1108_length_9862_cov_5.407662_8_plen_189_part_00